LTNHFGGHRSRLEKRRSLYVEAGHVDFDDFEVNEHGNIIDLLAGGKLEQSLPASHGGLSTAPTASPTATDSRLSSRLVYAHCRQLELLYAKWFVSLNVIPIGRRFRT